MNEQDILQRLIDKINRLQGDSRFQEEITIEALEAVKCWAIEESVPTKE